MNFTDRYINAIKPPPKGKRDTHTDATQPGLILFVTHTGRKTLYVLRRPDGRSQPVFHRLSAFQR